MLLRITSLLFLSVMLAFLAGCAQNNVPLRYSVPNPSILTTSGAKTICVVDIKDARPEQPIGVHRNGETITTQDNVSLWFSKAIGARLSDLGFLVTHAPNMEIAQMGRPDYVLSGEVQRVWLEETAFSAYDAQLVLFVSLRGNNGVVSTNTLNSSASKTLIPLKEKSDLVLLRAMDSLMDPFAQFITQRTRL